MMQPSIKAMPWNSWVMLVLPLLACSGGGEDTSGDTADGPTDAVPAVSCADFESPIPAEGRSQLEAPPSDLRDYRYCEVLPAFVHGDVLCVEVYNTLSFNDCPEEEWAALDADDLQAGLGAQDVYLNGPRHWVINGAEGGSGSAGLKIASFGGLQMARPGLLELEDLSGMPENQGAYTEIRVERSNTWFYSEGNEVYELSAPSGEVYIMQSYSRMVDTDLTIDELADLGSRLSLPEGWTFSSRVLDEDYALVADGEAFVVRDDLVNTYQRRN